MIACRGERKQIPRFARDDNFMPVLAGAIFELRCFEQ
jgi:hypothetical protein